MGAAARIGRGPSVARISAPESWHPPSREEERVEAFRRRPRARDDALVAGETRGHGGRHRGIFLRASRAQVGYVIPWILGLGLTERPHRGPLRRRHARPRERLAMCAPCRGPERGARKTLQPPPRPRWISRAGRGDPRPTRRRASPRARAARCAHQRSRNFHRLQIVTSESGGECGWRAQSPRERHKTQLSLRKTKVRRHNRARRCRASPSSRRGLSGKVPRSCAISPCTGARRYSSDGPPPPATPRDQDSRVSAFAEAAPRALTTTPRPSQRRPPRARRTPTTRRLERETPRLRVSGLRGDR
jgi:hypothetical protein